MKKLLLVFLLPIFVWSCSDDDYKDKEPYSLTTDITELDFYRVVKDAKTISLTSGLKWKLIVPEGADWITVSTYSGQGSSTISVDVKANDSDIDRSATIVFEGVNDRSIRAEVKINQDSKFNILDKIEDTAFREYCKGFDLNLDGQLSSSEGRKVKRIELVKLDVTEDVADLTGIVYFPNLEKLDVYTYADLPLNLQKLDVSTNSELKYLNCSNTKIDKLDLSNNKKLEYLACTDNKWLTELNLSQNPDLKYLYCHNDKLTLIDLSQNKELTLLSCSNNQLSALDISENTQLTILDAKNNLQLTTISVWKGFTIASYSNFQYDTTVQFVEK